MDPQRLYVVETLVAKPDTIEPLKQQLLIATTYIRKIPGVYLIELIQDETNTTEFVFVLMIDSAQRTDIERQIDEGAWHEELARQLPDLLGGDIKRIAGVALPIP